MASAKKLSRNCTFSGWDRTEGEAYLLIASPQQPAVSPQPAFLATITDHNLLAAKWG